MIHIPLYMLGRIKLLKKERQVLLQVSEKEPTLEDLANNMETSVEQIIELIAMSQAQDPLSLETRQRVGDDEIPLSDLLEDTQVNSPEQIVIARDLEVIVQDLLRDSNLKPRERDVICWRFGLIDGREHSLEEVSSKIGLSHEAVRQNEFRALKKLAPLSRKRNLNAFVA